MRKLILSVMQSLDGYMEGPNGALDWHAVDEEYNDYAVEQLNTADTLLFGRKTFELMQQYWTSEQALEADPVIAAKMNSLKKVVCSSAQKQFNWNNTCWLGEDIKEQITVLKKQQGKNILLFGSATLAQTLAQYNLIDEYCIILNPVYIGGGKPLLSILPEYVHLQLTRIHEFDSGKLLLCYTPRTN